MCSGSSYYDVDDLSFLGVFVEDAPQELRKNNVRFCGGRYLMRLGQLALPRYLAKYEQRWLRQC